MDEVVEIQKQNKLAEYVRIRLTSFGRISEAIEGGKHKGNLNAGRVDGKLNCR